MDFQVLRFEWIMISKFYIVEFDDSHKQKVQIAELKEKGRKDKEEKREG